MIYAVNRLTKEHRVVEERYSGGMRLPCRNPNLGKGWDYIQADADGWIEWSGGECPLPYGVKYDVRCASGSEGRQRNPEEDNWLHVHGDSNIIAYRPIIDQPASDEPKGWCGEGLPPVGEKILVRKNDNDWLTVEVVAHDDGGVIYRDPATTDHGYKWAVAGGIRPIPTPRERWVEKALSLDCDPCAGMLSRKDFCGELYDSLASGKLSLPEKTK